MTTTLTTIQYTLALRLSRAHGHWWGCAPDPDGWTPPVPDDYPGGRALGEEAAARAAVLGAEIVSALGRGEVERDAVLEYVTLVGSDWGGVFPALDKHGLGHVVHTTGTGRVSWRIRRDGGMELTISRPAGEVLVADWDEDIEPFPLAMYIKDDGGALCGRHVDTMEDLLLAAGVPAAMVEAEMVPLRRQAADVAEHLATLLEELLDPRGRCSPGYYHEQERLEYTARLRDRCSRWAVAQREPSAAAEVSS